MKLQATIIILLIVISINVSGQTVSNNNSFPGNNSASPAYLGSNTVTTPVYKLYIGGSIKSFNTGNNGFSSPSLYLANTTASTGRNYFINSSSGGLFQIVDSNAGNLSRFVINSSGNIGIGNTSPSTKFHLTGGFRLEDGSQGAGKFLVSDANGLATWQTLSGSGITSLNGLTGAIQTFATGTSGTDFGISSSGNAHTFNIPDAAINTRGLVTTGMQTFAGTKTFSNDVSLTTGIITGTTTTQKLTLSNTLGSNLNYNSTNYIVVGNGGINFGVGAGRVLHYTTGGSGFALIPDAADIDLGSTPSTQHFSKAYIDNISVGKTLTPTARIDIAAGTALANTAPLKFTSGTLMSTPENGAIEYNGTHYYATVGGTRYQLDQQGGGFSTADNGLTASTSTNVRLGGTLLQNTIINQSENPIHFRNGDVTFISYGTPEPDTARATVTVYPGLYKPAFVIHDVGNNPYDLFQIQSYLSGVMTSVNGNGIWSIGGPNPPPTGGIVNIRNGPSLKGLVLRDANNQTGTLIEGQDNTGQSRFSVTAAGVVKIIDGNQASGKVFTSDAYGNGSWQTPSGGGSSLWTDAGGGNINNTSQTGNVGIGTNNPLYPLHIGQKNDNSILSMFGKSAFYDAVDAKPGGVNTPRKALSLFGGGTTGYSYNQQWFFKIGTQGNLGGAGQNINTNQLIISTACEDLGYGIENNVMALLGNGNLGIGTIIPEAKLHVVGNSYLNGNVSIGNITNFPTGYQLAVAGNIIAEKVRVKLQSAGWPDYVFHPTYKLTALKDIEQFIKANNHLPEVPSAEEIEKNGLDLGDGQTVLLKKIEELTLHMIEMDKRLNKLSEENEMLKKEIKIKQ